LISSNHALTYDHLVNGQIVDEDLVSSPDLVQASRKVTGTHQGEFMGIPPTGKSVTVNLIDITRFDDGGLAREHWGVVDQLGLMQQLGVNPAPGHNGS
jgi:predicted ester cyclase